MLQLTDDAFTFPKFGDPLRNLTPGYSSDPSQYSRDGKMSAIPFTTVSRLDSLKVGGVRYSSKSWSAMG